MSYHKDGCTGLVVDELGNEQPRQDTIQVDPTELHPGDVVIALNDYDRDGCHCDVLVTVKRGKPGQ